MPDRNLTQDSSVPSTAEPIAAPMISCAIVPTTISDKRGRDAEPDREQARDQRETKPQRRKRPNAGHAQASKLVHSPCADMCARPFGQALTSASVQTT